MDSPIALLELLEKLINTLNANALRNSTLPEDQNPDLSPEQRREEMSKTKEAIQEAYTVVSKMKMNSSKMQSSNMTTGVSHTAELPSDPCSSLSDTTKADILERRAAKLGTSKISQSSCTNLPEIVETTHTTAGHTLKRLKEKLSQFSAGSKEGSRNQDLS